MFTIERAYDPVTAGPRRVLIDRLWPRGVKKADLDLDEWLKDAAPSTELRTWYGHETDKYAEFRRKYRAELSAGVGQQAVAHLHSLAAEGDVALITATRDVPHSGAEVLYEVLTGHRPPAGGLGAATRRRSDRRR